MSPSRPPEPTVRELKARVAACEHDLHEAVEEVGQALESALDWKKAVRDHPVQTALVAAAVGLVVIKQPGLVKQIGLMGLKSLGGLNAGAMVQNLLRRFLP